MKIEIHFEFRASLRKFQYLNFWNATAFHILHHLNVLEKHPCSCGRVLTLGPCLQNSLSYIYKRLQQRFKKLNTQFGTEY
jgi:hypothetical protein